MLQVLKGIEYLHNNNLVHGDIKPMNILVDWEGRVYRFCLWNKLQVKLCDLDGNFLERAQTHAYAPPIEYQSDQRSVDIWSLGITIMEFIEKVPPSTNLFAKESMYPPTVLSFAKECIKQVEAFKPSAKTLLEHTLVSQIKDETLALKNLFSHKVYSLAFKMLIISYT